LLLISCFDDFWLIECKSWIGEWLLLKQVWIHFLNVFLCLYVDGVSIRVVVYEFWMEIEKIVGFGGKWTKWLSDEFEVNWGYDFKFVVVLNVFWCLKTNVQVLGSNLGSRGSKMRFWGEIWGVPEREQPRTGWHILL